MIFVLSSLLCFPPPAGSANAALSRLNTSSTLLIRMYMDHQGCTDLMHYVGNFWHPFRHVEAKEMVKWEARRSDVRKRDGCRYNGSEAEEDALWMEQRGSICSMNFLHYAIMLGIRFGTIMVKQDVTKEEGSNIESKCRIMGLST